MPVNYSINIFVINSDIIFCHVPFIKYLWISKISIISIRLKSTEKNLPTPFNPVFFQIINCKIS